MIVANKDWKNWTEALPVEDADGGEDKKKPVSRPRPGHADLAGAIKYNFRDARYILERASARETAARVAVGAVAKPFLAEFGIGILSHVIAVGPETPRPLRFAGTNSSSSAERDEVLLGCVDPDAEKRMKVVVDVAYRTGDTVGGIFEVVAHDLARGLGIAHHLGFASGRPARPGHRLHAGRQGRGDRLRGGGRGQLTVRRCRTRFITTRTPAASTRGANRAGGLEGGMTNGEDVLVRGFLKPISTLRRPLESVDLETREPAKAAYERVRRLRRPRRRRHRRGDGGHRAGPGVS